MADRPSIIDQMSPAEKAIWVVGGGVLLTGLATAVSMLAYNVILGSLQLAGLYAAIVSGLATLALVGVTTSYAIHTRRMATVSEQSRQDELEFRANQRKRDVNKLRCALLEEIRAIQNLNELSREYSPGYSVYRGLVPSKVYEANAGDLGLLTEAEIEAVVDYYTQAKIVKDYFAYQRDRDTTVDRSIFDEVYRRLSFHALFFRKQRKERTKAVREQVGNLAENQAEAITKLESNLDSQPPMRSDEIDPGEKEEL